MTKNNTNLQLFNNHLTGKLKPFRLVFPLMGALSLLFILLTMPERVDSAVLFTSSPENTPVDSFLTVTPASSPFTATIAITYTPILTATSATPSNTTTPTSTPTPSPTVTPALNTITPTITISPTEYPDQIFTTTLTQTASTIHLPLIYSYQEPVPPVKALFCTSLSNPLSIPDNSSAGVNVTLVINDHRIITDLDVSLDVNHTWVGDLRIKLTHAESNKDVVLINRPGIPQTTLGCAYDNIRAIMDGQITSPAENRCASSPAAISGIYQPQGNLGQFNGISVAGTWTLNVSDQHPNDTGSLRNWCLVASISEVPPPPTPEPTIPPLPSQAIINGVTGKAQALPLDCESRSAVDWAKFFGYSIGELTFFNNLPSSDNPDKGFVGNVYGTWGQIPPQPYGVHAEPVASLLRSYGVPAYAHRPLKWELLKAEIAAGNPVFVWIVGSVNNGIPIYYTPADGLHTIVARYEHTVIVTGYTNNYVYYLNGATIYSKTINEFLDSWSALGNMAITTQP